MVAPSKVCRCCATIPVADGSSMVSKLRNLGGHRGVESSMVRVLRGLYGPVRKTNELISRAGDHSRNLRWLRWTLRSCAFEILLSSVTHDSSHQRPLDSAKVAWNIIVVHKVHVQARLSMPPRAWWRFDGAALGDIRSIFAAAVSDHFSGLMGKRRR
jgi:hypothetical protein